MKNTFKNGKKTQNFTFLHVLKKLITLEISDKIIKSDALRQRAKARGGVGGAEVKLS